MSLFVDRWAAPYLPAQLVTTLAAMFATFALNRRWTFVSATSWPGLSRPSTPGRSTNVARKPQRRRVDARDKRGHDAAVANNARKNYGHFTSGGIDERIESTLPPVFNPKIVPRS